jgi:hypothetical protein
MPQQRRPSVSAVMIEVPEPANWPYTTSRQLDVPVRPCQRVPLGDTDPDAIKLPG